MGKKWFKIKKVSQNVWGLAEFNHSEKVVSYLFVGKKKALLFDTGMGAEDIKKEVCEITNLNVTVINSHCHPDHIGGNIQFDEILQLNNPWGLAKAKKGFSKSELIKYFDSSSLANKNYHVSPFKFSKLINPGSEINVEPFLFTVISTPGHTPDSICLFEKTNSLLLTGDTLYPGAIYLQFSESSLASYKESVKKLLKIKRIKKILPGHNSFNMSLKSAKMINSKLNTMPEGLKKIIIDKKISLKIR